LSARVICPVCMTGSIDPTAATEQDRSATTLQQNCQMFA
jgi:hypothetical protein